MDLIVLIGLQASGKTTFARSRLGGAVYVSKDAMRNVRNKGRRQEALLRQALASGRTVVIDNTNPTVADRAPLIALARAYGARVIGYYFSSRLPEALIRNRARPADARVPDVALHVTRRKLECPSYAEGFDELYAVELDPGRREFRVTAWPPEVPFPHEGEN